MANATSITLTALTANAMTAAPTAQILDTGTDPVTLETAATAEFDRIIFSVTNSAAENLVVSVAAGENPPAFRKDIGALSSGNIAQNGVKWFGPFESARFAQADQKLQVTFTPGGTINATFYAFVLPKA